MTTPTLSSQLFRLSRQFFVYGLGVMASQVAGFLLLPLYTRYLTPEDYGVMEIFGATHGVLGIIFVLGLGSALFMAYYGHTDDEGRKKVVSTGLIVLTIIPLTLTIMLVALAGSFSSLFFNSEQYAFYFRIVFLTLFFDSANLIPMEVFRAREQAARFVGISLARLVVNMGLNTYFVVVLGKGVLGILEGGLITSAALYLVLSPLLIRSSGIKFSMTELKSMLAFALPLVPANLSSWVMTLSDRYLLQFLSTSTQLGLYSLGYRFGVVTQVLIVQPFCMAWAPFFWSVAKEDNAKETYSHVLSYFTLLAMVVVLGLSVLSKEVLVIMTVPAFYDAYKVIPLIALSYLFYGWYFIFLAVFHLRKKSKYQPLVVALGAGMNLGINFLVIPRYGMMGAASISLVSFLSMTIATLAIAQRLYPVRYQWGRIARIFLAAGLVYGGSLFIVPDSVVLAAALKVLALFCFLPLLYFLGVFSPEEIKKAKVVLGLAGKRIKLRLASAGLNGRKR